MSNQAVSPEYKETLRYRFLIALKVLFFPVWVFVLFFRRAPGLAVFTAIMYTFGMIVFIDFASDRLSGTILMSILSYKVIAYPLFDWKFGPWILSSVAMFEMLLFRMGMYKLFRVKGLPICKDISRLFGGWQP